jgi:hypothetical protein
MTKVLESFAAEQSSNRQPRAQPSGEARHLQIHGDGKRLFGGIAEPEMQFLGPRHLKAADVVTVAQARLRSTPKTEEPPLAQASPLLPRFLRRVNPRLIGGAGAVITSVKAPRWRLGIAHAPP